MHTTQKYSEIKRRPSLAWLPNRRIDAQGTPFRPGRPAKIPNPPQDGDQGAIFQAATGVPGLPVLVNVVPFISQT